MAKTFWFIWQGERPSAPAGISMDWHYYYYYYYHYSTDQSPSWNASNSLTYLRNSPNFVEPEGLLPHIQEPATCPYRKIKPLHALPTYFFKIYFNIILQTTPRSNYYYYDVIVLYCFKVHTLHTSISECPWMFIRLEVRSSLSWPILRLCRHICGEA